MKKSACFIAAFCLLAAPVLASSFKGALNRLDVSDPEFVAYADFQGDVLAAGSFLTDAYLAYLMTGPEVPPIPVDFNRLFEHLGFSSLQSAIAVSEARRGGGFTNQMLIDFSEPPRGLFTLFGDANQAFTIQDSAPADADMIMEMNLNGDALYAIVRNVIIDMMGPVGEGLIEAQMNQPIVPEGPTLAEIISRLNTQIHFAAKAEAVSTSPEASVLALLQGNAAIEISNVADLLDSFAPILQQAGFIPSGLGNSMEYTLTIPLEQPMTIAVGPVTDSNDLMVAINEGSRDWFLKASNAISSSPEFQTETAGLPSEGLSFWYTTAELAELQIQQLDAQSMGNEKLLPLFAALKSLLMDYTGPQSGVSFLDGNSYRITSYQPTSYKTNIALAGAVIPMSAAATFAAAAEEELVTEEDAAQDEDVATPSPTE